MAIPAESKTSPNCSGITEYIQFLRFPAFEIPNLSFSLGFCPFCSLQDTAEKQSLSAQDTKGPESKGNAFVGTSGKKKTISKQDQSIFDAWKFVRPSYK